MKTIIPFIFLFLAGCMGLSEKRLGSIDRELAVLDNKLAVARAGGSPEAVSAVEAQIAKLDEERVKVSARATVDVNNRRLLFLTILGIIAGGVRAAGKSVV